MYDRTHQNQFETELSHIRSCEAGHFYVLLPDCARYLLPHLHHYQMRNSEDARTFQ